MKLRAMKSLQPDPAPFTPIVRDILFKFKFTKIDEEKIFLFPISMTLSDILKEIKEKWPDKIADNSHFFLDGEWFRDEATLGDYDAKIQKSNLRVLVKCSDRPLRLKLPDGSIKTVTVDQRDTVFQVIQSLGKKLGIVGIEEYGLVNISKIAQEHDGDIEIEKAGLFSKNEKLRREKKKAGTSPELWEHKKDHFLENGKLLTHLDIKNDDLVLLKKRYHFTDHFVTTNEALTLKYTFHQAVHDVLEGHYLTEFDTLIDLATFQLQYCFGDYNERVFQTIDPAYYLPIETLDKNEKKAKKKIQDTWAKLAKERLDEVTTMYKYLEKTRDIKDYGMSYFQGLEKVEKSGSFVEVIFGINREELVLLDKKKRKVKQQWPLNWVKAYSSTDTYYVVDFGQHADKFFTFFTPDSKEMVNLTRGYIYLNMNKKRTDPGSSSTSTFDFTSETVKHAANEELAAPEKQSIVYSQVNIPKSSLTFQDPVQPLTPNEPTFNSYTPKDSNCISNALTIPLQLPSRQEMEQLAQDIELSATTLGLQSSFDVSETFVDFTDEGDWQAEALIVCRQNVRKYLASICQSALGILDQFSGLSGKVDTQKVVRYVDTIAERSADLSSSSRVASALIVDQEFSLFAITRDIADTFRTFFASLPLASHVEFFMSNHLQLLDRIGTKSLTILDALNAHNIDLAYQEDILWSSNSITNGCYSLIFPTVDKIIATLKDQSIPIKLLNEAASKVCLAIKLLSTSVFILAPLVFDEECQEMIKSLCNHVSYTIEILLNTSRINTTNSQLKQLMEINCASTMEFVERLLKTLERPEIIPETPIQIPTNLTGMNSLLQGIQEIMLDITSSMELDSDDPSIVFKLSKDLSSASNEIIKEIKKQKKGSIWDQIISDLVANAGEVSSLVNVYALSVFKIDEEEETEKVEKARDVTDAINRFAESVSEVESMWEL